MRCDSALGTFSVQVVVGLRRPGAVQPRCAVLSCGVFLGREVRGSEEEKGVRAVYMNAVQPCHVK